MVEHCSRLVLFDTRSVDTFDGINAIEVNQPGQLKELLKASAKLSDQFRILYRPKEGDNTAHFEACCALVMARGSMVLACDEIDSHMKPSFTPPRLYEVLNYGRHRRVALAGTARRTAQVSREYTANCSAFIAFNTNEPRDLSYFEKSVGSEFALQLPNLSEYAFARKVDSQPLEILKAGK